MRPAIRPTTPHNLLNFVNLTGTQFLSEKLLLSGNVYYRHLVTDSINGNINDSYLDGATTVGRRSTARRRPPPEPASPTAPGQNASVARCNQQQHGLRPAADRFAGSVRLENQAILGADYD